MNCRRKGLSCQEVLVPGGTTTTIVVRSADGQAPRLVIVHHFPLYRCKRCGRQFFYGSDRSAVSRALERRLWQGFPLPPEINYPDALVEEKLPEA